MGEITVTVVGNSTNNAEREIFHAHFTGHGNLGSVVFQLVV